MLLKNPFSLKIIQAHTINLAMLNVMNVNEEHRILLLSLRGVAVDFREGDKAREVQRHLTNH